jgi:hypothetical protein
MEPTFFGESSSSRASARASRISAAGQSEGSYSALALACTAAGALLVGAGLAASYFRPKLLQKDAPPAPANIESYWRERVESHTRKMQRRAAAPPSAASASAVQPSTASAAAPLLSPHAGKGESVDLDALDIRPPTLADVDAVAVQMCDAFDGFNHSVGLSNEFTSLAFGVWVVKMCTQYEQGLIAVRKSDGAIMGSVFVDETDVIGGAVGCGPWSAKWGALGSGVGRELVTRIVSQSLRHGAKSMRLIQIAANNASFSLYSSLGFDVREPVMAWKGLLRPDFIEQEIAKGAALGFSVRPMRFQDVQACDVLCKDCNGISRAGEMSGSFHNEHNQGKPGAMEEASATKLVLTTRVKSPLSAVGLCDSRGQERIVGYCTGLGAIDHAVTYTQEGMQFLIASAHRAHALKGDEEAKKHWPEIDLPALPRVPYQHTCIRLYPALTRWLSDGGMRAYREVNLMVMGEWQPIKREAYVYSPSISF